MKNLDHKDPNKILESIRELDNMANQPLLDMHGGQDVKVKIRVNENVAPAMFKPDPLIPGGFIANSLTVRAMRPDIFVLGDSLEDLETNYHCVCGKNFDVQFWKICPYCAREISM
ncbi:MAG TPA: hypothetical protein VNJ08_00910 [Bacteriovoracaceae bacterium]|nr:hypothetical protein [Bacteriovoracaceae bacterium]